MVHSPSLLLPLALTSSTPTLACRINRPKIHSCVLIYEGPMLVQTSPMLTLLQR
jgi:hypothetical protein